VATQIYVNLPVTDLDRSVAFFTRLGFAFDPQFSDENATCMIVDENIFVMLLVDRYFATFTPKPVADATKATEVLLCITRDTRDAVDRMVADAIAAGGTAPRLPKDHGFMYQHGFHDPDGHVWELIWMPAPPPDAA
jgi:hypothetical protein